MAERAGSSAGRLVVVGGGIIGTMHAWMARRRGYRVVQLEREAEARGASVRNFGLIWVSGRTAGAELELTLRSRRLWDEAAASAPGVGLRANGSLTVAQAPEEMDVLEEAAAATDAPARGWSLVGAEEARRINPALGGKIIGALFCAHDATVEPRKAAAAIRDGLRGDDGYEWVANRTVVEAEEGFVRDHVGTRWEADRIVLCCGADLQGVAAPAVVGGPLRRVRLQMLETAPHAETVTTSVADGDSLRYYPAYAGGALARLRPQDELAAAHAIQLLLVQRRDGGLTIGDTHQYEEPFDFAVRDDVETELLRRAEGALGAPVPPVARRWAGVYSQTTDGSIYFRRELAPGVDVVTGPGGRGMTLSAAMAEETFA